MNKDLMILAFAAACVVMPVRLGIAQTFPTKQVSFVVPVGPGGANDIMARLFAGPLEKIWGQNVVVESRLGAGASLSAEHTARAAPDGHTLGFVATAHVINPSLRSLPFDTVRDLAGVTLYGTSHILLSARLGLPAQTLPEIIVLAKRSPGKLTYATAGVGTAMHMMGELLKSVTNIDILHVPFKDSNPIFQEVIAGRIDLAISPSSSSMAYIQSGRVRPIAVASMNRAAGMPEIPTVAEVIPGFEVRSIFGVVVPVATPRWIVDRLYKDFMQVLQYPEVRARFLGLGVEPAAYTPEQFDAFIRSEIPKWRKVIHDAGIKPE